MPVLPRLILMLGVALYHPASALAQSSTETMPEALRRLFESIPAPRLPDSLGFARAGVIATDGEGIVRVRPDAARIRVGVLSEGASPTEVAQENATRMSSVVDAVKKAVGEPALSSGTVEVRTDAVILTPIYADRSSHPAKPTVSGYRANNTLRILVRELDQRGPGFLGAIIEQANQIGANEISGPEFLVFSDAKPLVEARVNAIEDARTNPHISQVSRCGGWVRAGGWFRTWPARVPAAVGGWAGSTMVSLVAGLVESRSQAAAALRNRA